MEIEPCDSCGVELEAGQIGDCDDCQLVPVVSSPLPSTAARLMADAQREADNAHHVKRVQWLKSDPLWVCGTPVGPSDRTSLLNQSQAYLRDPAGAFNHCNCEPRCAL